jgi:hypothetical protein
MARDQKRMATKATARRAITAQKAMRRHPSGLSSSDEYMLGSQVTAVEAVDTQQQDVLMILEEEKATEDSTEEQGRIRTAPLRPWQGEDPLQLAW